MCAQSMSNNWMRCINSILDCFILTSYYYACPPIKRLKVTLLLCYLWCHLSITTFEDKNCLHYIFPFINGTSDLQLSSWIWLSFGLQNSFPHITINFHSTLFSPCSPGPWIAQISPFPNISLLYHCASTPMKRHLIY